jgi:hypothetical protein
LFRKSRLAWLRGAGGGILRNSGGEAATVIKPYISTLLMFEEVCERIDKFNPSAEKKIRVGYWVSLTLVLHCMAIRMK